MAIKSQDKPRTDLQETYWRFWGMFNLYTKDNITLFQFNTLPALNLHKVIQLYPESLYLGPATNLSENTVFIKSFHLVHQSTLATSL